MTGSTGTDPLSVIVPVLLFLLGLIGALVAYIFNDLRRQVKTNNRHMRGLMKVLGPTMWRGIAMEEYLKKRDGYDPPKEIEWPDDLWQDG